MQQHNIVVAWPSEVQFKGSRVLILLTAEIFVVCCVGTGLCEELIIRTEESCRVLCVCVCVCVYLILCDLETSTMIQPRP